ncbi:hypothetical protein K488DRAFT_89876 [Vararia minispora EC-137]|uniref:Uncharacterized protein n=1 Tax=Vararia minispora EC-137 TaxID=1314806 RepID=A0ACB8Q9E5_9AGAM|nr:hypothetical protein K488DRAFT_89876 [Vararia minispora EC-137]
MLFGPEWMRPKHPARQQNPPSPPPSGNPSVPTASSYSSLVAPAQSTAQENPDPSNPFLYSKDEMLRIYKEGGGRGGLGLEVERWEGVVREVSNEPAAFKEWSESERKLFSGSLNSEIRRRQSSDYLSPLTPTGDRPKLNGSGVASPMRERFNLIARRRDSSVDQPSTAAPRKLSLNATQSTFGPARDAGMQSPRGRGPLTPGGIDGVLSSGDTWMSRRRASEAGRGAAAALRGDVDGPDGGGSKIKEEDENEGSASSNWRAGARERGEAEGGEGKKTGTDCVGSADQSIASIASDMTSLALKDEGVGDTGVAATTNSGPAAPSAPASTAPAHPPGLPTDVAAIEWTYLDPQGQVQGPFRADLMQTWSNQGYFTPDLLVKRASIDFDWTHVGVLMQRLGTENIFITSFDPVASTPPGLQQTPELPPDTPGRDTPGFGVPYQPIPTRTSQISALEPYYGTNSPASQSPASSFGAARFGNGTPDPSPFGSRLGGHMADSPVGPRGGFTQDPYSGRRQTALSEQSYNDPQFDPSYGRNPYNNFVAVWMASTDGYGFGAQAQGYPNQMPWGTAVGQNGLTGIRTSALDPFSPHVHDQGFANASPLSRQPVSQDGFGQRDFSRIVPGTGNVQSSSPFDANQQYTQSPSLGYLSTAAPGSNIASLNRVASGSGASTSFIGGSSASWTTADQQSAPKRTGSLPFDHSVFPTSRNTVSLIDRDTMPPPQPWSQPQQTAVKTPAAVEGGSPWYNASIGVVDEGWRQVEGPNSLTVSNLGQHNQQQAQEEALAAAALAAAAFTTPPAARTLAEAAPPPGPVKEEEIVPSPVEPNSQSQPKAKRKASVAPAPAAPAPTSAPEPVSIPPVSSSPSTEQSAALTKVWSTDEDKKRSAATLSLRDIQEAEVRKTAERKAAERERERAARAAYSPPEESVQPFIASWGLPTSQAGAGGRGMVMGAPASASSKETVTASTGTTTPSPATPSAPTPVWSANGKTAAGAIKKTMKEIQEEEERRKAKEAKEAAMASGRRGYADTTTKIVPTVPVGGAWTTVGSNGKTTAAAPSPAARPSAQTAAAAIAASGVAPAVVPAVRKPTAAAVAPSTRQTAVPAPKPAPAPPKVDDAPVAPSPEFMKWLSETLRALSNSVSYDDIVSMLLSFPLEVDTSTQELISDLIYANSVTLDGRRFAAEFVARRKTDAAGRKATGKGGPSIADVVRAQPKPAPGNEWGAFKVVNKKKKGGRA